MRSTADVLFWICTMDTQKSDALPTRHKAVSLCCTLAINPRDQRVCSWRAREPKASFMWPAAAPW